MKKYIFEIASLILLIIKLFKIKDISWLLVAMPIIIKLLIVIVSVVIIILIILLEKRD